MVIDGSGKVGIGTTTPIVKLDVSGSVKSSSLSGTGTRMVVADASGVLSTQAIPSGADNLGNHTATQNLNMNTRNIDNIFLLGFTDGTLQNTASPFVKNSFPLGYNSGIGTFGFGTGNLANYMLTVGGNTKTIGNVDATGNITINGNISASTGNITSNTLTINSGLVNNVAITSDKKYKINIVPIDNALSKILKLKGVSYDFDTIRFPQFMSNEITGFKSKSMGFIAQEVKEVLYVAVWENKDGNYAVNYDAIIPVIVEAMKEQQSIIEKQSEQIKLQLKLIEELQANTVQSNKADDFYSNILPITEKKQENGIVLYQNKPNPFTENTIIQYKLPANVNEASILVFDLQGKQLKKYENLSKGEGSVTINGGELYAGMFIYSLIVDGKEVAFKRMILTK